MTYQFQALNNSELYLVNGGGISEGVNSLVWGAGAVLGGAKAIAGGVAAVTTVTVMGISVAPVIVIGGGAAAVVGGVAGIVHGTRTLLNN